MNLMRAHRSGLIARVVRSLRTIEDLVHVAVAVLLSVLALVLLIDVIDSVVVALKGP
jgi:hypothetical protein